MKYEINISRRYNNRIPQHIFVCRIKLFCTSEKEAIEQTKDIMKGFPEKDGFKYELIQIKNSFNVLEKQYDFEVDNLNKKYGDLYFVAIKETFADRLKNHSLQIIAEMGIVRFNLYNKNGLVLDIHDLSKEFKIIKDLIDLEESLPYHVMGTQSYNYVIGKDSKE